jgi:hypothetical protein
LLLLKLLLKSSQQQPSTHPFPTGNIHKLVHISKSHFTFVFIFTMHHLVVPILLSAVTCSSAFSVAPVARLLGRSAFGSPTHLMMFTGIVEEMGRVVSLTERDDMTLWDGSKGKGTEIVVEADVVMDGAYLG